MARIYLSPPQVSRADLDLIRDAVESNWIAPLGPHVDAFEAELAAAAGAPHAAALSSGTAAVHLALRLLGVGEGDTVLCPTLTFIASAAPVQYLGAEPVFLDVDRATWNLDPVLLEEELEQRSREGRRLPRAVVAVDLYGQSADYDPILEICGRHGVAVVEDAAEALGARYKGRPVGGFGRAGVFSFNGNKIITTSGGGGLVSDDGELVERARFLATQARDPEPHYEHSVLGYNYRMSNLLAALGRAQLRTLPERLEARRRNFELYRASLADVPGIEFMPEAPYGRSSRWLTTLTIDPEAFGASREDVRLTLEAEDIEARPVWKPMHLQPVFRGCRVRGGEVSERIFEWGLCLPSGSQLLESEIERICEILRRVGR